MIFYIHDAKELKITNSSISVNDVITKTITIKTLSDDNEIIEMTLFLTDDFKLLGDYCVPFPE